MKQRKENVSRILEDEGKCMADKTKVFSKRDKNVDYMNQMLPVEDSFDISHNCYDSPVHSYHNS